MCHISIWRYPCFLSSYYMHRWDCQMQYLPGIENKDMTYFFFHSDNLPDTITHIYNCIIITNVTQKNSLIYITAIKCVHLFGLYDVVLSLKSNYLDSCYFTSSHVRSRGKSCYCFVKVGICLLDHQVIPCSCALGLHYKQSDRK